MDRAKAGPADSDAAAAAKEVADGFLTESASQPGAFDAPPADTTINADAQNADAIAKAARPEGTAVNEQGEAVLDDGDIERAEGEESAGRRLPSDRQVAKPKPGEKAAAGDSKAGRRKPRGTSLENREGDLRGRVDQRTYELREAERKLAETNARIREAEAKLPKAPAAAAAAQAGTSTLPERPKAPKYKDYDTDAEYETAVEKYEADIDAFHTARMEAVKGEITKGVDARLTDKELAEQNIRLAETTRDTLLAARAEFPDWDAKHDALADVQSSWHDPQRDGDNRTPFLTDLAKSMLAQQNKDGGRLLHWLGSDPERAQFLADLRPNRPLRDALVQVPEGTIIPLLDYFASEEGEKEFNELKRMHPIRMQMMVGALSTRLVTASSGSETAVHTVTKAQPSRTATPDGGAGAREKTAREKASDARKPGEPFESWMETETEKERTEYRKRHGLAS